MKIKHISILLVLLLLLSGCGITMESRLEKAKDLVLEGKFEEAEELYLELVEKYKNKSLPNLKLGQFYLYRSDLVKAEKYLMSVEEESSDLAINLVRLAADSNNKDLFNKTFNQYKDKEIVQDSPIFFEDLILAACKFKELEKIEESINRVSQLNLKLSPQAIEKAYSTLRSQDMEELANTIIEKDIYNREIGDLSLIPKIIKETENREFVNLTSGYFLSPDRLDIAILYGLDYDGYFPEMEIVLLNGLNGEVISIFKEETIHAYMNIDTFDASGYGDHMVSIWGHAGGSGTPSSVDLYRYIDDNFEKIKYETETDREITFKDNFEYKVSSDKLGKTYLMQLELEEIPYYISERIYNQEGKLLNSDELGSGYEHQYIASNLSTADYVYSSLELWDTYENKSFLVEILSYFKYEEGKLFLVDLLVNNAQGKPKALNYKDVAGYKEIDFRDLASKEEKLEDFLKFHLDLFNETENTIRGEYGKPLVEDYYGVRYLKYDDFIAFTNPMDPNELVTSVWTNDILGLENNTETIIKMFGPPEYSGYDEEEMESYMRYSIKDYQVTFTDIGKEYPYVKIKPK